MITSCVYLDLFELKYLNLEGRMWIAMAYHEFGIMEYSPKKYQRFDEYEPKKFELVKINDDFIEPLLQSFDGIRCYWHTLECPEINLAYCGITLIPPKSINTFIFVFSKYDKEPYNKIIELFKEAKIRGKYIIHYGI